MNSNDQNHELWKALLKACDDYYALCDIRLELEGLHSVMDGNDAKIEHPISEGLRALIGRVKELSDAFTAYEREIEGLYQSSAWQYAEAAYGIRKGDRVQFTDWRDQTVTGAAHELQLRERVLGELMLRVILLKKDGSQGKKDGYIQLAHDKWKNLDNEQKATST